MLTYDQIRRRTRFWSFLVLVVTWFILGRCSESPALAAVRYSETLITKASGSTNAVVLPSASVRVFNPGATTSAACSGSTISVYSQSTIQDADVVEVASTGLTFTVTSHTSTSVTVSGSPTCTAQDRLLRVGPGTSTEATIYFDEGGTAPITQPATASSSGRITFFTNASGFDLKATASNGLRYINYGVITGSGAAGGWTEVGSETTTTDKVGVGITSTLLGQVHIKGANSATIGSPTSTGYALVIEGTSPAQKYGIYCSSDRRCALYDITDSLDLFGWGNGSGSTHALYMGNVSGAASMSNQGTLMLLQEGSSVRGIILQRSGAGSTGNLLEIRDQTGAAIGSWSPANALTAGAVTGTTGSFTDTGTTSLAGAGRVTGSTFVATTSASTVSALTIPSPGKLTINGDQYTWPADFPGTSGYHLATTTGGVLSWDPPLAGCAGAYTTVAIPMPAHQTPIGAAVEGTILTPGTAYCSLNTNFHYYDNGFGPVSRYYGCSATEADFDDFYTPPGSGAQSVSMWAKADGNIGGGASLTVEIRSDAATVGSTCTMSAGSSVCTGPTNQSFSLASGHKWDLKVTVTGTAGINELLVTYCFGQ